MAIEVIRQDGSVLIRKIIKDVAGNRLNDTYVGTPANCTDSYFYIVYKFEQFSNEPAEIEIKDYSVNVIDKIDINLIATIAAKFLSEPVLSIKSQLPEM